jgi:hypothetical protein
MTPKASISPQTESPTEALQTPPEGKISPSQLVHHAQASDVLPRCRTHAASSRAPPARSALSHDRVTRNRSRRTHLRRIAGARDA